MLQLIVLYPQPTDVQQFEATYAKHLVLLHEKTGIPTTVKPYNVTKFLPTPEGTPSFFQMFMMPFESPEALQAAMSSAGMQGSCSRCQPNFYRWSSNYFNWKPGMR